jgi:hypothetical protein
MCCSLEKGKYNCGSYGSKTYNTNEFSASGLKSNADLKL